jgi:hypothetical protein
MGQVPNEAPPGRFAVSWVLPVPQTSFPENPYGELIIPKGFGLPSVFEVYARSRGSQAQGESAMQIRLRPASFARNMASSALCSSARLFWA